MTGTRPMHGHPVPRLLERLLAAGRITEEVFERAVLNTRRNAGDVEEALFDALDGVETDFLKLLATHYRTRYVSTDRLSRADIDPVLLQQLPRKVAERHNVFPVVHDASSATLAVVIADPDNVGVLEEVRVVSRVREVRAYVARPAAIKAAIAKYYAHDTRAFQVLENDRSNQTTNTINFDRTASATGSFQRANEVMLDAGLTTRGSEAPSMMAVAPPPPVVVPTQSPVPSLTLDMPSSNTLSQGMAPSSHSRAVAGATRKADISPGPETKPRSSSGFESSSQLAAPSTVQQTQRSPHPQPESQAPPSNSERTSSAECWLETLNVLVTLLETSRPDLRGHSSQVARLTRRMCERLGLSAHEVECIVAAAYLHDLGKASAYHLTALNVAEYEGHRLSAKKSAITPSRMMESVKLPDICTKAMNHMYERVDGKGLPTGLAGKEIPLGARIIAIADTWADLTQNAKNPYRRVLRPKEAGDVLDLHRGTLFDPTLVDLFKQTMLGDDKSKQLAHRKLLVLIDPDPEESTILELKLANQGFEVRVLRTADAALKLLTDCDPDLVLSEVQLEPFDGFELLSRVRQLGKNPTWVYLTALDDREGATRGFELGAVDYVNKPVRADVFVTRLRRLAEQTSPKSTRGVAGSLEEMSLPDMVQILSSGRKSGALQVRAAEGRGEIFFVGGEVHDARFGNMQGNEAFYALIRLKKGDFTLDASAKSTVRRINTSAEGLLLEAMRRMDEAAR